MFLFKRKKKAKRKTRLLFATDFHGAENVFKKFLNAAKIYDVNVCVIGGDITGKGIVPIRKTGDGRYEANLMGALRIAENEDQLGQLKKEISFLGMYSKRIDDREIAALKENPGEQDALFARVIVQRIEKWIDLAEERLKDTDIKCFITGGNDDPFIIEKTLDRPSAHLFNAESKVIRIDERHEILSSGYGNPTPWNCPRDIPEEELEARIDSLTGQVEDMHSCIFNLHIPPINTGLATCTKLDVTVDPPRPIIGKEICAGSTAVRNLIERHQPKLGLHGHIHESRGITKVGNTVCLNPGSEYSEGVLRAAIVDLDLDSDRDPVCQLIAV